MAGKRYTLAEKYQVAVAYMITGSQKQAAEMHGVPQKTVNHWVKNNDEEFNEAYQQAVQHDLKQYDAKVTSLIDKSLNVLRSKLDDPDNISAKDAAIIHSMLYDKRALSRNQPTQITKKDNNDLEKLALAFEKIAKQNSPTVVEGETVVKEIESGT